MSSTLHNSRTWAVREALRVIERLKHKVSQADSSNNKEFTIIFETGYSPSGLPHLGTVGEVIRVLMVKQAFDEIVNSPNGYVKSGECKELANIKISSKLMAFIDDMDGLRKVPTNVPEQEMMTKHLGMPLTKIPDPFGCCESFAHHNTGRLRHLLQEMGFLDKIELHSSTEYYDSGKLNDGLKQVLEHHQEVLDLMLPTLGDERQQTYSPFLPISPVSGRVLQVPIQEYNTQDGIITFQAEDGNTYTQSIYNGKCKLQWKPDFGMRWYAIDVDYEMYGKDLIHTVELSRKICTILGGEPPVNMHYELFLSDTGGRISKSKGNESLTLTEWIKYTPRGCLSYFLFQNPQRAKRIRSEDIPVYVENYLQLLHSYAAQSDVEREENPVYYISDAVQYIHCEPHISYKLALSIACAYNVMDLDTFKGFFKPKHILDEHVIESAYHYYKEEIQADQKCELMPAEYTQHCHTLLQLLRNTSGSDANTADVYQTIFFQVARDANLPMAHWFASLYKAVIGTEYGPKMGTFCSMYGADNFCKKLESMMLSV